MTAANQFPIVGVGASAGGIEALEGLFAGIPERPGFAIVIVTHLNPDRESLLHEIVARHTQMPVHIAADEMDVDVDNVYVMPEDAILGIASGRLVITRPNPARRGRKPIDVFFSALARDRGEWSAGIVLSGGDGDGTLGIKVIKEQGGLTLAQVRDGHGPGHPDMPDSAIATGYVDFAVPADQMGARLVQFARSLATAPGDPADDLREGGALDAIRTEIYAILRRQVGHDFAGYKSKTFLRRVQRRMQVSQLVTAEAYLELLQTNANEAQALFRDLLINVTSFFRDAEAFENLATLVIPKLFEGRGAHETVRIWVPGCATGEEVFSIAILLREYMETLGAKPRVQVFATDIDEHALGVARAARYPAALLDAVSPNRRRRFFLADGGSYVLAREVRDLCIFSPHSVIRDPPFSRMDLVSCRNLLIYFGVDVQNQVLPTFHYALRDGGYLFLGTSENVSQFRDLFAPLDKKYRIFRKREDVAASVRLPLIVRDLRPSTQGGTTPRRPTGGGLSMRQSVQAQVLDRFAPPHVLVNRDGDVVYFSARTGKYLEAAAGLPNRQLLTMARKGLRLDLRTMFREAVESNRTVLRGGVAVESDDGRVQIITITVEPLVEHDEERLYLVLFTDEGPTVSREEAARSLSTRDGASLQLEEELRETRERLQSLVEEYETALEELKSSNEELQSVNEEFQSTNEELEASKEELQSVNEELHTVNGELTGKVDALDRANTDLQNLFNSTNVATVFLDGRLVIRSYTPAIGALFNVLPSDRGRPITDLTGNINLPRLAEDVAAVISGHPQIERQIKPDKGDVHYLLRVTPYQNTRGVIDGAAVTFLDVTGLTRAEARLRVLVAELQHRTRNLLGVVQAIARQTIGKGGSLEAYKDRLSALGRVQGLISHSTEEAIELGDILRLEMQAHGAAEHGKVTLDGPRVPLHLDYVQAVALVLHELATNAVKHGALKMEAGRLAVSWHEETNGSGERLLMIEWRETGVPIPLGAAERSGFGRPLIQRSLSLSLRARTDLIFGADGVTCRIELPLDRAATNYGQS